MESLRFVNDHNEVPEHVVEEANRLGFWADTGISKGEDPEEEDNPKGAQS